MLQTCLTTLSDFNVIQWLELVVTVGLYGGMAAITVYFKIKGEI